jgi:hypothetical protein
MLYGKGQDIMKRLQSCLVLGYQLRYKVKPALARVGVTMENVLFLTDSALEEDSFRACSFMWSIRITEMPDVHASRLEGTSKHLKADGCDERHVFLKFEAYRMEAEISIVSDIDIVVTNHEKLAEGIRSLCPGGERYGSMKAGEVAVMARALSDVAFGEPMRKQLSPRTIEAGLTQTTSRRCRTATQSSRQVQTWSTLTRRRRDRRTRLLDLAAC